ncbi:Hypothetical protein ORPV_940 [Orpheovirus IHUMI-LCC2]|uniref:Uncharacterized protein n=1 Tax=Orpheovirus IHUMI-LCC2 TaxID=2023057 RepID=A0A2I2L5M9_9VIRU|nr:Hypothetical protein ORPV_940 [Orpheovirus IHUMI-LCC2]SNW62844.1 Hypothetical protein ORPV_940 [Orpheovirus IHUMI-LCC2]
MKWAIKVDNAQLFMELLQERDRVLGDNKKLAVYWLSRIIYGSAMTTFKTYIPYIYNQLSDWQKISY